MQPGKLLAVGFFVFWAASQVVTDFKIAAELKIVSCILNNILHLGASKQECIIPWQDDG